MDDLIDGPEDDPSVKGDAGEATLKEETRPPLPSPGRVPEGPTPQSKGPGIFGRLWANRLNLARHLILPLVEFGGALVAVKFGADSKVALGVAVAGEMLRKHVDDTRRASGKADMITAVVKLVAMKPKQRGDAMSTRKDVEEVGTALYDLTMAVMSKDEDKAGKILTATLATIKEGADLMDIPKDDIPEAVAHALSMAAAQAIAAKVVYTDEKPAVAEPAPADPGA